MFSRHDFIPFLPQASRTKLWGFSHFAGWTFGAFLILVYELGLAALPGAVCTNVHDAVEFEGSLPRNFFSALEYFLHSFDE